MEKQELKKIIADIITIYSKIPFTGNFDKDVDIVYKEMINKNKNT